MKRNWGWVVAALVAAAGTVARADGEARTVLSFSATTNVGFGRSVFVVGSHADLGAWSPLSAVKLRYTGGDVWSGQVAVSRSTGVEYKFISRLDSSNDYCNGANVQWFPGANLATSTPPLAAAPYAGKTVFYHSAWTQVFLLASTDGVLFVDHPLTQVSTGRSAGEYLYRGDGLGGAGGPLEFVLHNGAGSYDKAPYGGHGDSNYFTRLDAFVLQDGNVFNYWPAPSVSAPQVINTHIFSTVSGITGRGARIYLPRGYPEHTGRRYPVLYLQDGTNVFDPGGANGSWSADAAATREINQGRLRETILVALDNIPDYRRSEYNPPTDTYVGQPAGVADKFLRYLFENVRPTLDLNYRTLTNRANTLVGGSSMGGLFSLYAAYETNVFGGALAMSPALTRAPNFTASLWGKARLPIRIYLDTGSAEGQVGTPPGGDYWGAPWGGYDLFLAQGYAVNEDLLMRIGCGHQHNETAWRARLPEALTFLLDVRDEPAPLLLDQQRPVLSGSPTGVLTVPTLRHHAYRLESTSNLVAPAWTALSTSAVERLPWGQTSLTSPPPSAGAVLLRAVAEPRP